MINVNDDIKRAYDVSTTQIDKIIVDGQEYRIMNAEYYDDCYEEGNIFGTAIARCLDFEIENIIDLEGKEIEYLTGIKISGVIQWINLGNFIIQSVEPNDTTQINKVTAMDYMLKTNIPYESKLNYSYGNITISDVLQEVCNNSGLTLKTITFPNSDFIVDSNQFIEGTLNRQVIQAVAQISGTVAKIKNDNGLYLINPNTTTEISKVFTLNNYKEAEIKRNTHPINLVNLGMADIEGENVVLRDETSIKQDGENSLIINDNPFAYTQTKREQLITALFNAVKGFEYKAYTFNCQGLFYLETMDKIQFQDKEGNIYNSYIFRFNYKSPKGLESTIEAPSIIKATVAYQNVLDAIEISKRTEILVDKQNQIIESVVSNVSDQNQKISQVTQTVNELNSKISDIADITTSKESTSAILEFEGINQSEPIHINIHPIGTNIAYLYPRENLYPSDDLFMPVRTLRFTNITTNEVWDYELPDDLLYYDGENYDEFLLDYDSQTVMINKRCGWNADGTVHLLDSMATNSYDFPRIELTDGDYKIELLGYSNAYMLIRLMAQNIYTTQFATKAEMNSEIKQTTEEIDISVDKKLSNYSTTTEMNSAINVKANEITSNVSATYETKQNATTQYSQIKQTTDNITSEVSKKVGNNEVISKINQSAETVGINANKIELSANDVLNLLAGNTINLTSKNIVISSDNFTVDKNGNIKLKSNNGSTGGTTSFNIEGTNRYVTLKEYYNRVLLSNPTANLSASMMLGDASSGVSASIGLGGISGTEFVEMSIEDETGTASIAVAGGGNYTYIKPNEVKTPKVTQTSLESIKKNIEKSDIKALELINSSDIYTYNFKSEADTDKKHYGFIIGDKYKTPNEVLSDDKQGIDTYSMSSIMWKAFQEQQDLIEQLQKNDKKKDKTIKQLQKEIKEMKGVSNEKD